jgi:pantoate--beta-alanine ligase
MRRIETLKEMTETARGWLVGGTVGFVVIKGALHEGHQPLIEEAQKVCEVAVVGLLGSCWPFATQQERASYQRRLEQELQLLSRYPNLVVFIPRFEELYPATFKTHVAPVGLPIELLNEGEREYVRLLMTLLIKLLHLVRPDVVYFGQKDALQIAILRQVIRDLNIDVHLHMMPTVREGSGLAVSSRNSDLAEEERQAAALLYAALLAGKALILQGERFSHSIEQIMSDLLRSNPLIALEFVGIYAPDTFLPVAQVVPGVILSVAAYIGNVRLIDAIAWLENGQWRM